MYAPGEPQKPKNRVFAAAGDGMTLAENNVRMHESMSKTVKGPIASEAKAVCANRMQEAIKRWHFGNQSDLADALGCPKETVSRWKKGFTPPRRISQLLLNFCDLVGIDPWSLWQSQLKITHKPKELLTSPSKQSAEDPFDKKVGYLKMSPAFSILSDVVEKLYEQEKERLQKSRS